MPSQKAVPPAVPLTVAAPRPRQRSLLRRAVVGLLSLVTLVLGSAWLLHASIDPTEDRADLSVPAGGGRAALARVRSWGYQLQRLDVRAAARSPHDLLVIDEAIDGSPHARQVRRNLNSLKLKPDGQRRLILSYLSIGEAEDYRPYWQPAWVGPAAAAAGGRPYLPATAPPPVRSNLKFIAPAGLRPVNAPSAKAPAWLSQENPEWRGNYGVRYWMPEWQQLIFGNAAAALDRIIAAGFDGVYLDRADVYTHWQRERRSAKADMMELIEHLSAYARRQNPDFVVVMQNAEELLAAYHLRSSLDAVAKEDLLFGVDGAARANTQSEVTSSLRYLQLARRDGLPILVVEYLDEMGKVEEARRRLLTEGFIPYFGPRALNSLGRAG